MNFNNFDINKLVILWQATENQPELRNQIGQILNDRIESNESFSREHIFDILYIGKKSLTISFIPTSESFKKYGQTIVVEGNYNDDTAKELLQNFRLNPPKNTFGIVPVSPLYTDDLEEEQIDTLKKDGFKTKDILTLI
jgi:hypothetical protein